jgi:hypothetical protein
MAETPEARYLRLLKGALTFSFWPEPPLPLETRNALRPPLKRLAVSAISALLRRGNLQLVTLLDPSEADRLTGRTWPAYAHTMVGRVRLDSLQACVETVLAENVEGDLLEAGVWRGGACILMRAVLAVHGITNRRVFAADSFAGLPPPDAKRYPADDGDRHHSNTYFAVSREEVEENFRKYGLLDDLVVFLPGPFAETLPAAPIEKLAILRIDADMYGSTIEVLDVLYPKLSIGGFCIVDDYALPGCRKAVDDFRKKHGIVAGMTEIDWTGRFWRK